MERYLKSIDDLSLAPLYDEDLIALLKRRGGRTRARRSALDAGELTSIMRFFGSLRFDRNEVHGVRLYSGGGARFSYSEYFAYDEWRAKDAPWTERVLAASGASRILPAGGGDPRNLLSVARALREPFTTTRRLASSRSNSAPATWSGQSFRRSRDRRTTSLLVYNAQDELIYPESLSPKTFVGRRNLLRYEGKDYIASTYRSQPSGLTLYGLVPYDDVSRETRTLTYASRLHRRRFLDPLVPPRRTDGGTGSSIRSGTSRA